MEYKIISTDFEIKGRLQARLYSEALIAKQASKTLYIGTDIENKVIAMWNSGAGVSIGDALVIIYDINGLAPSEKLSVTQRVINELHSKFGGYKVGTELNDIDPEKVCEATKP